MWQIIFIILLPIVDMFPHFNQSDYIITSERVIVNDYNPKYTTVNVRNSKFNRTHIATNGTWVMKMNFGYDLKVVVQANKFTSNEYRFFPITFTTDFCDVLQKNEFGLQNLYNCGNMSGCPLVKGTYLICNWGPDYKRFPPHIPEGKYRLDLKYVYKTEDVFDLSWYGEVKSTKFMYLH